MEIDSVNLRPNTWNPNQMDPETREKERLSIHRYGFLDPLTVRLHPLDGDQYHQYEIIDGEHRFRIGVEEGLTWFPCWVVDVDDDTARELTAILNELRGRPNENKLKDLLSGLIQRRDEGELRAVMPFDRERFDALVGKKTIDWGALEQKRVSGDAPGLPSGERWVERVFRMPADVAEVVDNAVARAKGEAGADNDWQGLEYVCAEYLGS